MFVFCTAAVHGYVAGRGQYQQADHRRRRDRPEHGDCVGGSVYGGSAHPTTGAVQNGVVAAGEAFTYKSDGTNWRAVVTYQNLGYWIGQANDLRAGRTLLGGRTASAGRRRRVSGRRCTTPCSPTTTTRRPR